MLLFGVTIPTTVPQRSEIPEGLMNYLVYWYNFVAENFELLLSLTCVKSRTQWHALTAAKLTFFFFLLCCETLLAAILGMLGNTTHLNILTSVKLEDWHAFTS